MYIKKGYFVKRILFACIIAFSALSASHPELERAVRDLDDERVEVYLNKLPQGAKIDDDTVVTLAEEVSTIIRKNESKRFILPVCGSIMGSCIAVNACIILKLPLLMRTMLITMSPVLGFMGGWVLTQWRQKEAHRIRELLLQKMDAEKLARAADCGLFKITLL